MAVDEVPGGPSGDGGRAAWRDALQGPYRNLFYANVTSSLGDWIGVTAVLALTDQILSGATRGTAFAVAAVLMARIVPTMLLGPVAGVLVDRWDRRRVLIWTDVGRGLVMALVPFVPDIFALLFATVVIEVMSTLFIPAKDAAIPLLVPRDQLVAANQLNLAAAYGTFPVGGAVFALVGGLSSAWFGDSWALLAERPAAVPIWVNSLTFFVSAAFVARIPRLSLGGRGTQPPSADAPGAWDQLVEGVRFIGSHSLVRGLVTGIMGAFLAAGAVISGGQLFATIVNAGEVGFGVLVAVVGTGLFAGILSVGPLSRRFAKEQLFAPGIATAGASLVIAALMPRLDLASIWVFVMGYGGGISFLSAYTILQERTDDEMRGRTFAVFNTGMRAALFVSLLVVPVLIGIIGPEASGLVAEGQQTLGEGPLEAGRVSEVPYKIGGVRISLILAGLIALAGAVYSGRSIHHTLSTHGAPPDAETATRQAAPHQRRAAHGLFIDFRGGTATSRTGYILELADELQSRGWTTVTDIQATGERHASRLSNLLKEGTATSQKAQTLIDAALYAAFVDEIVCPAVDRGHVVLAGAANNGAAMGWREVPVVARLAIGGRAPDLCVDLPDQPVHEPAPVSSRADRKAPPDQGTGRMARRLVFTSDDDSQRISTVIQRAVLSQLNEDPFQTD